MLMNLNADMNLQKNKLLKFAGFIAGLCLFLVLVAALRDADIKKQMVQTNGGEIGLIKNLGMVVFKEYVVPFEISSVLFLSAMVGAVVIGKKE
jgi:NADH-quinone oxidoreductase subunit J